MKLRQYITAFSLTMALTSLSPAMAAEAEKKSGETALQSYNPESGSHLAFKLSPKQMDNVHAGLIGAYLHSVISDAWATRRQNPQYCDSNPMDCQR